MIYMNKIQKQMKFEVTSKVDTIDYKKSLGFYLGRLGCRTFYKRYNVNCLQEKLEKMQKEATAKAREQMVEQQKQEDEDERLFGSGAETHAPESVSFE